MTVTPTVAATQTAETAGATRERPVRIACIGAARMASWFDDVQFERAKTTGAIAGEWVPGSMATVCRAIPRAELVAVCDLRPELVDQMRARWDVPAGYTDFREMVARERPDIVAIVTSYGSTHARIAAEVAETGLVRGIYCEKPIASTMEEADRVVAACREHRVAYSCAHVARWNARYRLAMQWIREGAIGEVRSVFCTGMGSLLHSGTHQTDAMAGFAGDVDPEWALAAVDVPADVPQAEWPKPDPTGSGLIQMGNGVQLFMDGRSPGPRTYHISGTRGKIHIWNDLRDVQLWRQHEDTRLPLLAPEALRTVPQEESFAVTQMRELIQVLDEGGRPSCDEVKAARALEMALGLHVAHRSGGRVAFPLRDRTFGVDTV